MAEVQLFPAGTVPEWTTPDWYADRESAPHLDQPLHRDRLLLASRLVATALTDYGLDLVVDLGAGDGGLLSTLTGTGADLCGYDLQQSNVDAAKADRGLSLILRDVAANPVDWQVPAKTVAVCTEMLEHLVDPHAFLQSIPAKALVVSSPWTETTGNAYEYHAWAWDQDGYRALIEQAGYTVVQHETVSMFQVALAVRP